jgi:DNA-binding MarR family transcriptional regulator
MKRPTTSHQLQDDDYQRLLMFRSELRNFMRWSEETAHQAGLTPSLHQLLLVIRGHPSPQGPTIREAAETLHIRHHSTVELAQRAEANGLLLRSRDPIDHREIHLSLTQHGEAQLETVTRQHLPRIRALSAALEKVTGLAG